MGGCKSPECDTVSTDIWLWAIAHNHWLSAAFTPGKHNVIADSLSWVFNAAVEWTLDRSIFDRIVRCFSQPDVDLFASRLNHQNDVYISWKPDPYASFVDAFSVNWARFANSYAFPHFCLNARCLQKVVQEKITMIIVVPVWTTQVWLTRLSSLLIEPPKSFRVTENVLSNPLHGNTHPLSPKLMLMACKISRNASLPLIS